MKQLNFALIMLSCIYVSCTAKKKDSAINDVTNINNKKSIALRDVFVTGIDISKYQGDEIDFITKKKDTLSFIICKATEGCSEKDPKFKNNWKVIYEKGFTRGAYHFYHSRHDPELQATHFLSVLDPVLDSDFPPIIDFEEKSIDKCDKKTHIQKSLLIFLKLVAQKTKRTPIIYTNKNTADLYLSDPQFANYDLWIAYYHRNAIEPLLPVVWQKKKWLIWQKNEVYKIAHTFNDFDIFNGSKTDLLKYINATIIK